MRLFMLFSMLFCHVIDDYYSQGVLANLKQKIFWEKNAPDELYRYDYIMALFMHSFSWSFMILLPVVVYHWWIVPDFEVFIQTKYVLFLFVNLTIHGIVDDLKANRHKINLIQDQTIHMIQIFITWLFW